MIYVQIYCYAFECFLDVSCVFYLFLYALTDGGSYTNDLRKAILGRHLCQAALELLSPAVSVTTVVPSGWSVIRRYVTL